MDALRPRNAEQVDVEQTLADRVALHVLDHDEVFVAADLHRQWARLPDGPQGVHEVVRVRLQ